MHRPLTDAKRKNHAKDELGKNMKEIQKKIVSLVISSIVISGLAIMITAFWGYNRLAEADTSQIIQLMCSEKRQTIDEKLMNIEQSVYTLYHYVMEQIDNSENLWQDERLYEEHIRAMKNLMGMTAKYTDGAVTVYYRLAPAIKGPKQGILMIEGEDGNFVDYASAYLRLLIFLPATLISASASSSLAFCMMYSTYKLKKQSDNIKP